MSKVIFFVFATMVALPVIYLVFTRNIIRAAFAAACSLLGIAALYVLLSAEFIAVVQILIYVGGITVLLIFGIMLTKRIDSGGVFTAHRGVFVGIAAFLGFLLVLSKLIFTSGMELSPDNAETGDQVRQIGVLYLTDHLLAFELVAFVLLVALVGAAFLAKKSNNT